MGSLARREWEQWFSDQVLFHRLVELCLDIKARRKIPEAIGRWTVYLHYLEPFQLRRKLGVAYRAFRGMGARWSRHPEERVQK
jgi:hypothetical protein